MNEFSRENPYDFKQNNDDEWFIVHDTAVTNTIPGSMVNVTINTEPICPNMTNKEFRVMAKRLLVWAEMAIDRRLDDLKRNNTITKDRMQYWFGRSDEETRLYLFDGFLRVSNVLKSLTPSNLVRTDPETDRILGCTPRMHTGNEAAHVCGPNTERKLISISLKFCTGLRDEDEDHDSRVSTIIHEITHFSDTFSSSDSMYSISRPLAFWGQRNSALSLKNADSLAGYVLYEESRFGY